MSLGRYHSCTLSSNQEVYCWGDNYYGQLGDGTTIDRYRPVRVAGLGNGVVALSVGDNHSCVINGNGQAYCWGYNFYAQLGDGSRANRTRPVRVAGLSGTVTSIAAADAHTCALANDGRAFCWGDNGSGQIGDTTYTDRLVATPVSGLGRQNRAIAAAGGSSCAINRRGEVYCWGTNRAGQLGDGTLAHATSPIRSETPRGMTAITMGSYTTWYGHTCGLNRHRRAFCWGENGFGQLGDGTVSDQLTPTSVLLLGGGVRMIEGSTGGRHTCAVDRSGRLSCWGHNDYGQLGDGTAFSSSAPVRVLGRLHRR